MNKSYTLYILLCGDGSYYTGISSDLDQRLGSHQLTSGYDVKKSRQWTKFHQPVSLAFSYEGLENYTVAYAVERYVKSLPKEYKRLLTSGDKTSYDFLLKKHKLVSEKYKTGHNSRAILGSA